MSAGPPEQLKKFVFSSKYNLRGEPQEDKLEVIIPEVLLEHHVTPPYLCSSIRISRHRFFFKF